MDPAPPDDARRKKVVKGQRQSAGVLQKDQPQQHRAPPQQPPPAGRVTISQRTIAPAARQVKQEVESHLPPLAPPVMMVSATNENEDRLRLVLQPVTRPINANNSLPKLRHYAGLIMVEAKCCEVDAKQHQAALEMDSKLQQLSNEQW